MDLAQIVTLLGIFTALCSLASFYLGRKKAATDSAARAAQEETRVMVDLQYIKDTVKDTTRCIEHLAQKLDAQNEAREKQYRDILIEFTELKGSYRALHERVDNLYAEMRQHHP